MNILINRLAISQLDGHVMTGTLPLTQDERLRVWWAKTDMIKAVESVAMPVRRKSIWNLFKRGVKR